MITQKPTQLCLPPPLRCYVDNSPYRYSPGIIERNPEEVLANIDAIERAHNYARYIGDYTACDIMWKYIAHIEQSIAWQWEQDARRKIKARAEARHARKVRAAIRRAEARERKECAA